MIIKVFTKGPALKGQNKKKGKILLDREETLNYTNRVSSSLTSTTKGGPNGKSI